MLWGDSSLGSPLIRAGEAQSFQKSCSSLLGVISPHQKWCILHFCIFSSFSDINYTPQNTYQNAPPEKNPDPRGASHPIKYDVFFTSAFSVVLATSILPHKIHIKTPLQTKSGICGVPLTPSNMVYSSLRHFQ